MGFILDGLDSEAYDRTYRDRELLSPHCSILSTARRRLAVVGVPYF